MESSHPDLVEIDRTIRERLDRVLQAEQEAAEVARRRSARFRDRLIDLEERRDPVRIVHASGETAGILDGVGVDHLDVMTASGPVLLPLWTVQMVCPL